MADPEGRGPLERSPPLRVQKMFFLHINFFVLYTIIGIISFYYFLHVIRTTAV